jgi:ribonuclease Z
MRRRRLGFPLQPRAFCAKLVYKAVIILDVPTPDHIESLVSAFATPAYSPFRVKGPANRKDHAIHVVYHHLGSNVLEDERYKAFMNGFSDDTQHLISSPDHNSDPLTFTSAGLSQLRLSQLDSAMFPLPHYSITPRKDLSCTMRSRYPYNTNR